ncbi:MAG: Na+:solute symporter [Nitrospirota bacterium]|nr:MAG: Na+:solute symporter [Nitrospirota bacterium]
MNISNLDLTVIGIFMLISLAVGLYFSKRASRDTGEFFLSGRNLPWWLAGTSMVATTFSSDTPLYITGLIRTEGIYENWQWWTFIFSGMLSVFFFAKLWRRLGVVTDVELIEMRYSGRSASILRGFKAVYFSLIIHTIIKAQVILAMAKILDVTLGWGKWESIAISTIITLAYSTMSGYWGVVSTDFMQFILAMVGSVTLAVIAVGKAGGMGTIVTQVPQDTLNFFPSLDEGFFSMVFMTFLGYVGLSWWSKYSSDGGGVIVQRMASCRNEKESLIATFYFNVANYGLRTWPWIIAALASLVLYPVAQDHESVYPRMVVELLPTGIKGLMLASFFAAFMSTLSTYLNLSSAYFVNDFYRPFVKRGASEKHYISVSRWVTIIFSIVTAIATYYVTSIVGVFKFLIAFGSGTGLVYIVRWFWWRVNAWSEISAMIASTASSIIVYSHPELSASPFYVKLFTIISVSTVVWVLVTFLTRPVEEKKLVDFFKKTVPGGYGWEPIRKVAGEVERGETFASQVVKWIIGSLFVIAVTIGTGKALLGSTVSAWIWFIVAAISGIYIYRAIRERSADTV